MSASCFNEVAVFSGDKLGEAQYKGFEMLQRSRAVLSAETRASQCALLRTRRHELPGAEREIAGSCGTSFLISQGYGEPAHPNGFVATDLKVSAVFKEICYLVDSTVCSLGEERVEERIRRDGFLIPEVLAGFLIEIENIACLNGETVAREPGKIFVGQHNELRCESIAGFRVCNQEAYRID